MPVTYNFSKTCIRSLAALSVVVPALAMTSHPGSAQDAGAAPAEAGVWYDDTGRGAVQIAPCGAHMCGHIVWLKNPLSRDGQPLRDANNPEPTRRNQPICGLQVLGKLARQPDGTLDGGWVYDPKVGKAYNAELRLASQDRLIVHGYAGLKMLGKSLTWTRVAQPLPPCSAQTN